MIHKAFNITEIAQRYYTKKGKEKTRMKAQKAFWGLKYPDIDVLREIISEINKEQNTLFEEYLKRKK